MTCIHGSLGDLAFTMYAPVTGREHEVRGRTGSWKVTRATSRQPVWVPRRSRRRRSPPGRARGSTGTLLGLGTECDSGKDLISTGKLDGVGWPYQTLLPRLGHGHLAIERWKDGASTVDLLPAGEPVAGFPGVEISAASGSDVAVISQIAVGKAKRAYIARFDGRA